MKKESYIIRFANPNVSTHDHFHKILEAIEHSKMNLLCRYDIHVLDVLDTPIGIRIDLSMNDDFVFSPMRLSGIARYLLSRYKDIYEKLKVGSRLFTYSPYELYDINNGPLSIGDEVKSDYSGRTYIVIDIANITNNLMLTHPYKKYIAIRNIFGTRFFVATDNIEDSGYCRTGRHFEDVEKIFGVN